MGAVNVSIENWQCGLGMQICVKCVPLTSWECRSNKTFLFFFFDPALSFFLRLSTCPTSSGGKRNHAVVRGTTVRVGWRHANQCVRHGVQHAQVVRSFVGNAQVGAKGVVAKEL